MRNISPGTIGPAISDVHYFRELTQYTFRKTVATLIAETSDSKTAAKQLGHSREGVTERRYIVSPDRAPDSSTVLDKGLGGAS